MCLITVDPPMEHDGTAASKGTGSFTKTLLNDVLQCPIDGTAAEHSRIMQH
jgi:hypothetical protein